MEDNEGKFVKGVWIPGTTEVPARHTQTVEISQHLTPYKSSISLNGKPLRCRRYEVRGAVREFCTILIELSATDVEFKSDSSILYIEVDGMKFKRID
jgi:tagatose-1,6-bisphosphate aldolase